VQTATCLVHDRPYRQPGGKSSAAGRNLGMSSAIVVDLGSSAVKCGLANSYLTDTQPSVVSVVWSGLYLTVSQCRALADPGEESLSGLQVTSTALGTASASDGTPSDGDVQAIRDGQVADWAPLERILHDALYMQVGQQPLLPSEAVRHI
jgi:actin-related protein